MNVDTTITTLEMCAGYGGIGLGIKNIFGERLRTIAYCELEGFAQANLISKMEKGLLDAAPIWSDLKTFPYESFHGLVDILIAGYPCQPFSSAGKRAGKEDPRHLWPWIADGIRLLQPTMCFFENVEGHISLGLSTVISDLEELGYKVSWGIFSAREVGAPHQRKRLFIMAHRNESGRSRNELGDSCEAGQGRTHFEANSHIAWPSRPGQQQHAWEPPRVVGNASSERSCGRCKDRGGEQPKVFRQGFECTQDQRKTQPPLGRDSDGSADWLDYAELQVSCDNRADELRLLGNGVVPATATRAFLTLIEELNK
jgi:DNA (cytosine-5)-methyltransferase 1